MVRTHFNRLQPVEWQWETQANKMYQWMEKPFKNLSVPINTSLTQNTFCFYLYSRHLNSIYLRKIMYYEIMMNLMRTAHEYKIKLPISSIYWNKSYWSRFTEVYVKCKVSVSSAAEMSKDGGNLESHSENYT